MRYSFAGHSPSQSGMSFHLLNRLLPCFLNKYGLFLYPANFRQAARNFYTEFKICSADSDECCVEHVAIRSLWCGIFWNYLLSSTFKKAKVEHSGVSPRVAERARTSFINSQPAVWLSTVAHADVTRPWRTLLPFVDTFTVKKTHCLSE